MFALLLLFAGLQDLAVIGGQYPRAYFFRSSEGAAARPSVTYEQWEKAFERLMGIEGKVLDEEVPGRSLRNIEFFTRFKQRHPNQLVMLHFNGNARDPRWQMDNFFAGHFLYFNGSKILENVPAESGETDIRVQNLKLYRTGIGRYRNATEDVALCVLKPDGKPDWFRCEQVNIVSAGVQTGVIRVKRGCYGTKALAFEGGRAVALPHRYEGPWGEGSHLLWDYNYSTHCPRDAQGRSLVDVLVEDVARRFQPGGELAAFDGLQFDVLHNQLPQNNPGGRGIDTNGDGEIDNGIIGGVNAYGAGVVEFCRRLRGKLPGKFILADGMGVANQRAFGILNGIESEGFPHLRDIRIADWSGGLNRHFFWAVNSHAPVFNYINHKFNQPDPKTGLPITPDLPFSTHRLVFAAAVFTDSAICYSFAPKAAPGELIGIWDELKMGAENKLAWLGKPLGPAVRPASQSPDLLNGRGKAMSASAAAGQTSFRVPGLPVRGPDLYVTVTARAEPFAGHPKEMARMAWASLGGQRYMTWMNQKEFTSGFYFHSLESGEAELEITVEGSDPVEITRVTAHAAPDAMYRRFERGLVLANPAPHPCEFDLAALFPGKSWRRLKGTQLQDPAANSGAPVQGKLTLGPKDALFLVATN